MTPRRASRVVAVALLQLGACAKQTDAETRAAFEAAANPTASGGSSPRARPGARPRKPTPDARTAWQGVADLVDASIVLIGADTDARGFTDAATKWCAVAPEPKNTADGPSYACFPRDALEIGTRSFTLDISPVGAIGLHMDELDEATSRALAEQARGAVARLCATPFAAAPADDAKTRAFQTCPVDGGSTLAVGCARSTVGPGWFVTITVLGEVRRAPPP